MSLAKTRKTRGGKGLAQALFPRGGFERLKSFTFHIWSINGKKRQVFSPLFRNSTPFTALVPMLYSKNREANRKKVTDDNG